MANMNLQLKKFDMKLITKDRIVALIGKRGSGKSFLAKDLLYYHRDIPIGMVISGTETANHFYSDIFPPIFIHDEYNNTIIDNFLKRQKKMKKRIEAGESINPYSVLVMDDCMFDNHWVKDKGIREIFLNGRHWGIFYIILMQGPMLLPPILRSNIDYVFILRESIYSNRKRLYEHYCGVFPTFDMFNSVLDECTNNYEALVVHLSSKSNKIQDQVFWYKAEDHGDFKLCHPDVWQYSSDNYAGDDDDGEIDINAYKSKKGPRINVKKIQD